MISKYYSDQIYQKLNDRVVRYHYGMDCMDFGYGIGYRVISLA